MTMIGNIETTQSIPLPRRMKELKAANYSQLGLDW
jgi:hypothetical protein